MKDEDRSSTVSPQPLSFALSLADGTRLALRACAVVGLTERFDETMLLLKKVYGWRMPFYERRNVGRHRLRKQDLSADVIRQIAADNRLDVALYAYAQELGGPFIC
jgi:hypothetical protein